MPSRKLDIPEKLTHKNWTAAKKRAKATSVETGLGGAMDKLAKALNAVDWKLHTSSAKTNKLSWRELGIATDEARKYWMPHSALILKLLQSIKNLALEDCENPVLETAMKDIAAAAATFTKTVEQYDFGADIAVVKKAAETHIKEIKNYRAQLVDALKKILAVKPGEELPKGAGTTLQNGLRNYRLGICGFNELMPGSFAPALVYAITELQSDNRIASGTDLPELQEWCQDIAKFIKRHDPLVNV